MMDQFIFLQAIFYTIFFLRLHTCICPLVDGFVQEEISNLVSHDIFLTEFSASAWATGKEGEEALPMILHGRKFTCQITRANLQNNSGREAAYGETVEHEEVSRNIVAMPCVLRRDMYWTYMVCVRTHVIQLHEGKGHFLGHREEDINEPKFVVSKKNRAYFVQHYTGGSECEFTGDKRSTEVRFICAEGKNRIHSVIEVETCHYVIEVYTPTACTGFKKEISQRTLCYPESSNFSYSDMFGWTAGLSLSNRNPDRDFEVMLNGVHAKDSRYFYFLKPSVVPARSNKLLNEKSPTEFQEMLQKSRPLVTAESLLELDNYAEYYHSDSYNESDVELSDESNGVDDAEISDTKEYEIQQIMEVLTDIIRNLRRVLG